MSLDPATPSRWPEASAQGTETAYLPGDLVEVRSPFMVKHYDAHGVRLGKVEKDAGPGAWWVRLPGYEKTIRFDADALTLAWRACKHAEHFTCMRCGRITCNRCGAQEFAAPPGFIIDIAKQCSRCNPPCPDPRCERGGVHEGSHRASAGTPKGIIYWDEWG